MLDNNKATLWSAGDQIYVCGNNGKVAGVLTLKGDGGSDEGLFEGYVSGEPSQLQHIVFPAPKNGKIDMGAREAGKLDAPMIGTLENGEVKTFNNVGGLLAIKVEGGNGQTLGVEATGTDGGMTGGSYTFNPTTGKLQYSPKAGVAKAVVNTDGWAYVPVATTTGATNGTETPATVDVEVTVKNQDGATISSSTGITITSGEIMGDDVEESTGLDAMTVTSAEALATALQDGGNIVLTGDIDLTSTLSPGEETNINLNDHVLTGTSDIFTIQNANVNLKLSNGTIVVNASKCCAVYLTSAAHNANINLESLTILENGEAVRDAIAPIYKNGGADNLTLTVKNCELPWIYVSDDFGANTKNIISIENSTLKTDDYNCVEVLNTDLTVKSSTLINQLQNQEAYIPGTNDGNAFPTVKGYCIATYNNGTADAIGNFVLENNNYSINCETGKTIFYLGHNNKVEGIDRDAIQTELIDVISVKSAEALASALQDGGNIVLTGDIDLTSTLSPGEETNINLNDHVLTGTSDIFTIQNANVNLKLSNGTIVVNASKCCAVYLTSAAHNANINLESLTILENGEAVRDAIAPIYKNGGADNLTLTVKNCELPWIYVSDDFGANTKNIISIENSTLKTDDYNCVEVLNTDLTVKSSTLINQLQNQEAYIPGTNDGNAFPTVKGYCIATYNNGTADAIGNFVLESNNYSINSETGKTIFYLGHDNQVEGIDGDAIQTELITNGK